MRIMYLNIDSDTTSRDLTEAELARVGLKAERVSAITGDNRPLAFNQSVYKAMSMARGLHILETDFGEKLYTNIDNLLLLEDDVVFENFYSGSRSNFVDAHCELPPDFMTLHLGCNIIGADTTVWQMPTPHSQHLAKLWNCWMSHATLYSAECVKFILDNMNPNVINEDQHIFDDWLRTTVLPMGRSYVMKPMIAYQRPRFSAIWQRDSDYTGCFKQGNEYLKRL